MTWHRGKKGLRGAIRRRQWQMPAAQALMTVSNEPTPCAACGANDSRLCGLGFALCRSCRQCLVRACVGKPRYADAAEVPSAARGSYRCEFCDGLHAAGESRHRGDDPDPSSAYVQRRALLRDLLAGSGLLGPGLNINGPTRNSQS